MEIMTLCQSCPCRTPLRPDPEKIRLAREFCFEPPLDAGIRNIVEVLVACGVETFESCEGAMGIATQSRQLDLKVTIQRD